MVEFVALYKVSSVYSIISNNHYINKLYRWLMINYLAISHVVYIYICTQSSKVKIFAKLARALASGINYPISADNNLQSYE